MDDEVEKVLIRGQLGAAAAAGLELTEGRLIARERVVKEKIFRAIDEGSLTGDAAMIACAQLCEIDRLLISMRKIERQGKAAASKRLAALDLSVGGDSPAN